MSQIVIHQCCHVVLVVGAMFHLAVCTNESSLKCLQETPVSFECPCCPLEIDSCKFKRLFKDDIVSKNGTLKDDKYEKNETHVTLKKCTEDDEGTYVWTCEKCGVVSQFHLEVVSAEPHDETSWNKMYLFLILIPVVVVVVVVMTLISLRRRTKKENAATVDKSRLQQASAPKPNIGQGPEARSKPQERVQLFPEDRSAIKS